MTRDRMALLLVVLALAAVPRPPDLAASGRSEAGAPAGPAAGPGAAERAGERRRMVDQQIEARGVRDPRVLEAMRVVPRHLFVPADLADSAYDDTPLPIGYGQTISQPYIVAYMTEALGLRPGDKVLEVGTGSGYQAAVLAMLTPEVYTVEIIAPLAERAGERLLGLGYSAVRTRLGDGYYGWEEAAPFDAIIVTAACGHVPPPLVQQLAPGGRIIIPVGGVYEVQLLVMVTKATDGSLGTRELLPVRFVPLTGAAAQ